MPRAFPGVWSGGESRAIDGQENPLSVILANKVHRGAQAPGTDHHPCNPQSFIIRRKVWDTLSAEEKKIVGKAAAAAELAKLRK